MKNKEEILYNSISKHGGLKGVSLEQFMDSINNGSTDMRKGLESTFEAMEEYRNQPPVYPLPAKEEAEMLVEDIEKLAEEYATNKSSNYVFRVAHEADFIAGFKKAVELIKPAQFTPTLPAKEEAERLAVMYGELNGFAKDVRNAIVDVSNTITALKAAGVSTKYHDEVLTFLKGM